MKLETQYLGLTLPHPVIPGASPLADSLDGARRLEDAGAPAIVMRSLFEEQIHLETGAATRDVEAFEESYPEALSYFPHIDDFELGPNQYLNHISGLKEAVDLPIIASLNGFTKGGWIDCARQMQEAGASALELNLYRLATESGESAEELEKDAADLVSSVRESVHIPLAVKLSPFYTALPHFVGRLADAGADAVVIFNRFYQPDIDPEELDVTPALKLSDSSELRMRLRWLAILAGQNPTMKLAASGGVHTGIDAVKAIMAGADVVQVVSALLLHGLGQLRAILTDIEAWMEEHDYTDIEQLRGSMSLQHCPDPTAFERANYMRVLQSWKC